MPQPGGRKACAKSGAHLLCGRMQETTTSRRRCRVFPLCFSLTNLTSFLLLSWPCSYFVQWHFYAGNILAVLIHLVPT
ncbi:hypothetical protein M432DRAFT_605581 [Thermoascus aurantiacus ATCC 26904]